MKATPLTQGIAVIRLMVKYGHSLGVTGIARELEMPKASVHRLLQSLQGLGFVQRLETGRYALCADIFEFVHEIASNFARNLRLDNFLRAASQRLNCSIYLNMMGRRDTYVVCAAGEEGNTVRLGLHTPSYSSSPGKVLIAQLPVSAWADYAPTPTEMPLTPYTNYDPEEFYAQLREAKRTGLAMNIRESHVGIVSMAVPIREPFIQPPRLAVSLVLRYEDYQQRDRAELEQALRELAAELENELGSR